VKNLCLIADLLFIPSLQEGFGIPLLEAGLLKLPIVCSGIPALLEVGQENVYYFSLHDSPDQIADKILTFITDLKPHKMFRHVLRNYVWDNIYQGLLLPLLEKVIGR
jgi:glycosyltransferase involved in cell wall biosynthesis